jgi:hypothetical protein
MEEPADRSLTGAPVPVVSPKPRLRTLGLCFRRYYEGIHRSRLHTPPVRSLSVFLHLETSRIALTSSMMLSHIPTSSSTVEEAMNIPGNPTTPSAFKRKTPKTQLGGPPSHALLSGGGEERQQLAVCLAKIVHGRGRLHHPFRHPYPRFAVGLLGRNQ